ncbi:MAG: F0F1 ATP synthase subunit B [Verrucomicrobia bacterium]|nr:F0F1 ATP synthase subunit B [Verrucomicrobiota bacterium]
MEVLTSIFKTFGVEWPLFIAQLIVFSIVFFILKKFAFGPIIEVLEARRKKIEQAMADAEQVKSDVAAAQAKRQQILDEANSQAQKMIAEAKVSADAVKARLEAEATAEAERIVARAKEASALEADRLKSEFQREAGRLIVLAAQKVTGKILSPDDHRRLSEEAARQAVA